MVAREAKDFAKFAPVLEEWVALTREACSLIDASRPAYDVRPLKSILGAPPCKMCATSSRSMVLSKSHAQEPGASTEPLACKHTCDTLCLCPGAGTCSTDA